MADLTDLERDALVVLAGQSDDYLIHPTATAFRVAGLVDEMSVSETLATLEERGYARQDEVVLQRQSVVPTLIPLFNGDGSPTMEDGKPKLVPLLDPHGNEVMQLAFESDGVTPVLEDVLAEDGGPVLVDEGWTITDDGRAAVRALE